MTTEKLENKDRELMEDRAELVDMADYEKYADGLRT